MGGLWSMLKQWFTSNRARPVEPTDDEWGVEEKRNCRIYQGWFVIYDVDGRVLYEVRGRIVEWPGLPTDVYLRDPPAELRDHMKGPCLQLVSPDKPWFKLHWEKPARDFAESRAYVERLLDEAFRSRRRKQLAGRARIQAS